MASTDASAMEIVTPSPKAPASSALTPAAHEKFLTEIGSLLEKLARDGAAPASATATLLEASAELEADFGGLLQSTMRSTTLALLAVDIADETNWKAFHACLGLPLRVVDYALHLLTNPSPAVRVDATLPGALLEYCLSHLSLQQINASLPALRSRMAAIGAGITTAAATPGEGTRAKLELLKAAHAVVKRDEASSSASDRAFSGHLRFALAGALPVWDRSGLNIKGERGAQGVQFADEAAFVSALKADLAGRPASTVQVDFVLYRTFWSLQEFLSDPFAGDIAARWPEAARVLAQVLSALEKTPVAAAPVNVADAPLRYLTSPAVFPVQLADSDFRRTLCTQLLVCLLHLRLTGDEITQPRGDKSRWLPRHEFCKGLFGTPGAPGDALHTRILALLRADGGDDYAALVEELLAAERFWTGWKTAGCANLERKRAAPPKPTLTFKRRRLSSAVGLRADCEPVGEPSGPGMVPWTRRTKAFETTKREAMLGILKEKELPEIFSLEEVKRRLREDEGEEDVCMRHASDPKFEWLALRAMRMNHLKGVMLAAGDKDGFEVNLAGILKEEPPAPVPVRAVTAMEPETTKETHAKPAEVKAVDGEKKVDVKTKSGSTKPSATPSADTNASAKTAPAKAGNGTTVENASAEKSNPTKPVANVAKKPTKKEAEPVPAKPEAEVKPLTRSQEKAEAK